MIKLSAKLSSGLQVTVEKETAQEVVRELAFFSELPNSCPVCQSDIYFTFRKFDTYDYLGMKCLNKHQISFGKHADGGLFLKEEKWKTYNEIKQDRENKQ